MCLCIRMLTGTFLLLCAILLHGTPSVAHAFGKMQPVPVAASGNLAIADVQSINVPESPTAKSKTKAQGKLKSKTVINKTEVTAKDGDVEIKVNKNQIKHPTAEDQERERAYKKEKERKLSLKYGAQYILFGILAFILRMYRRK